jgi:hypothetical protein
MESCGSWRIDGEELVREDITIRDAWILFGDPNWTDYDFYLEAKVIQRSNEGFIIPFRVAGLGNQWMINVGTGRQYLIQRVRDGTLLQPPITRVAGNVNQGEWYKVLIRTRGPELQCFLNGQRVLWTRDPECERGAVGLQTHDTTARFRNIKVTNPEGDVLFEGLPECP